MAGCLVLAENCNINYLCGSKFASGLYVRELEGIWAIGRDS